MLTLLDFLPCQSSQFCVWFVRVVNKKKKENKPEKCGFYRLDIFRYNTRSCGAVACMYVPIQFSWGVFKISRLTLSIWREISKDGGKQENISHYEKFFNNLDEF